MDVEFDEADRLAATPALQVVNPAQPPSAVRDFLRGMWGKCFGALTADLRVRPKGGDTPFNPAKGAMPAVVGADESMKTLLVKAKSLEDVWTFIVRRVRSGSEPKVMIFSTVSSSVLPSQQAQHQRLGQGTPQIEPRFLTVDNHTVPLHGVAIALADTDNHLVQTLHRQDTTFTQQMASLGDWFFDNTLVRHALAESVDAVNCPLFTIPLMANGHPIATISVGFGELDTMTQAKLSYIYAMRDQLAQLVWNMLLEERLAQQALRDPLTGLYNFTGFYTQLARCQQHATDQTTPLSLLRVNFNDLMGYNLSYGVVQGDLALQGMAQCVDEVLADQPEAVLARLGGDELGIILPHTSLALAQNLGRQIEVAFELYDYGGRPHMSPAQCLCHAVNWPETVPQLSQLLPTLKHGKQMLVARRYAEKDKLLSRR